MVFPQVRGLLSRNPDLRTALIKVAPMTDDAISAAAPGCPGSTDIAVQPAAEPNIQAPQDLIIISGAKDCAVSRQAGSDA